MDLACDPQQKQGHLRQRWPCCHFKCAFVNGASSSADAAVVEVLGWTPTGAGG